MQLVFRGRHRERPWLFRRSEGPRANTATLLARPLRPLEKTRAFGITPRYEMHHHRHRNHYWTVCGSSSSAANETPASAGGNSSWALFLPLW